MPRGDETFVIWFRAHGFVHFIALFFEVFGIASWTSGACIHGDVEAAERVVREFVTVLESLQIQELDVVNGNGTADEIESLEGCFGKYPG